MQNKKPKTKENKKNIKLSKGLLSEITSLWAWHVAYFPSFWI